MLLIALLNDPITTAIIALHLRIIEISRRFIIILNNALLPSLSHALKNNKNQTSKPFILIYGIAVLLISIIIYSSSEYIIRFWTGDTDAVDSHLVTMMALYFCTLSLRRIISTGFLASSRIGKSIKMTLLTFQLIVSADNTGFVPTDINHAIICFDFGNITFVLATL